MISRQADMPNSKPESYIRDWLTMLASTSGILITVCLMVLAVLYAATTIQRWQLIAVGILVGASSICLLLVVFLSLNALGALIITAKRAGRTERQAGHEAIGKTTEPDDGARTIALRAKRTFQVAVGLLIAAILLVGIGLPLWNILVN